MQESEGYKGIYAMHKYWGKKPFNVVSNFIENYSKEGDIVLDSFCGSGVTAIEAIRCKRKAIAFDINPIAIKITNVSLTAIEPSRLDEEFRKMKKLLKSQINKMYEIECPNCGRICTVSHVIWNQKEPIEVWSKCTCKISKNITTATAKDYEQSNSPILEPKWFPETKMIPNSRINVQRDQNVSDLFTNRAIVGLSLIKEYIDNISDREIKETMEVVFTGCLSQASKLVFVIRNRGGKDREDNKADVGSWVAGYWVPKEHFEINVWNCFENRYSRVKKGKNEVFTLFNNEVKFANCYSELTSANVYSKICSATQLDLPDDSVDYVFIDPPHTNRVLYGEMSLMWNAWLGSDSNISWENEIVVSESKERKKSFENYNKLIRDSIKEIGRVLKPNCALSIAFNSLEDSSWFGLLNACTESGFKIADIKPLEYSATSVMQDNRENALKTDFVITSFNMKNEYKGNIEIVSDTKVISEEIAAILEERPMETYEVINAVMVKTIKSGFFYAPSKIVDELNSIRVNFHF